MSERNNAFIMNNNIACNCKGCKKRHMNCHSDCEDFLNYRKKLDDEKERARIEKITDIHNDGWSFGRKRKKVN